MWNLILTRSRSATGISQSFIQCFYFRNKPLTPGDRQMTGWGRRGIGNRFHFSYAIISGFATLSVGDEFWPLVWRDDSHVSGTRTESILHHELQRSAADTRPLNAIGKQDVPSVERRRPAALQIQQNADCPLKWRPNDEAAIRTEKWNSEPWDMYKIWCTCVELFAAVFIAARRYAQAWY